MGAWECHHAPHDATVRCCSSSQQRFQVTLLVICSSPSDKWPRIDCYIEKPCLGGEKKGPGPSNVKPFLICTLCNSSVAQNTGGHPPSSGHLQELHPLCCNSAQFIHTADPEPCLMLSRAAVSCLHSGYDTQGCRGLSVHKAIQQQCVE